MSQRNGRATRYAVNLPVRYRLAGSEACGTGWTENLSVSGLLFTTAAMLGVGNQIEVWVQMWSDTTEVNRSTLYCNGSVVRQVERNDWHAAAVRITRIRVVPPVPDFTDAEAPWRGERL